jgi:hypothetical protein
MLPFGLTAAFLCFMIQRVWPLDHRQPRQEHS